MGAFKAGGYWKKGTFAGGWGLLARVSIFWGQACDGLFFLGGAGAGG